MNLLYFSKLLDQLFEELKTLDSPLVSFLQPGVSKVYINEKISDISLLFPEELYIFYGWKNGIANKDTEDYPLTTFTLFTLANPISIEDSVEIYKFNCIKSAYWGRKYFPIFESGLGDYFLLDGDEKSTTHGMVMLFSPTNPYFQDIISLADSLVSLIETILECYRGKVYHFEISNDQKKFVSDPRKEYNIWEKNNPNSEYRKVLQRFNH